MMALRCSSPKSSPADLTFAFVLARLTIEPGASRQGIVQNEIGIRGFGSPDDVHGNNTKAALETLSALGPSIVRFTSHPGGHCCWNNFHEPAYREDFGGTQRNICEWMLTYRHQP